MNKMLIVMLLLSMPYNFIFSMDDIDYDEQPMRDVQYIIEYPLHHAIQEKDYKGAMGLIKYEAAMESTKQRKFSDQADHEGFTPIAVATIEALVVAPLDFIACQPSPHVNLDFINSVDQPSPHVNFGLDSFCQFEALINIIESLLESGASTSGKYPPLMIFVSRARSPFSSSLNKLFSLLLKRTDLTQQAFDGSFIMHMAAENKELPLRIYRSLFISGASIKERDSKGRLPVDIANELDNEIAYDFFHSMTHIPR